MNTFTIGADLSAGVLVALAGCGGGNDDTQQIAVPYR